MCNYHNNYYTVPLITHLNYPFFYHSPKLLLRQILPRFDNLWFFNLRFLYTHCSRCDTCLLKVLYNILRVDKLCYKYHNSAPENFAPGLTVFTLSSAQSGADQYPQRSLLGRLNAACAKVQPQTPCQIAHC